MSTPLPNQTNLHTKRLVVDNNPTVGHVLTCADLTGRAEWQVGGGGGGGSDIGTFDINSNNLRIIDGGGTNLVPTASIVGDGGGHNSSLAVNATDLEITDGNSTQSVAISSILGAGNLGDLSDVTPGSLTNGHVLTYNTSSGGFWENAAPTGGNNTAFAASGGNLSITDAGGTINEAVADILAQGNLTELGNVNAPGPGLNQVLTYDGGNWIAQNATQIGAIIRDGSGELTTNAGLTNVQDFGVAIGHQARIDATGVTDIGSVSIGYQTVCDDGISNVAIGQQATAGGPSTNYCVAIGREADATNSTGSIAIGYQSSGGVGGVGIGNGASAGADTCVGIGPSVECNSPNCIAIGNTARADVLSDSTSDESIAIGANSQTTGASSIALGGGDGTTTSGASATSGGAIAIGVDSSASGTDTVCIGNNITSAVGGSFNVIHRVNQATTIGGFVGNELSTMTGATAAGIVLPAGTVSQIGNVSNVAAIDGYMLAYNLPAVQYAQYPAKAHSEGRSSGGITTNATYDSNLASVGLLTKISMATSPAQSGNHIEAVSFSFILNTVQVTAATFSIGIDLDEFFGTITPTLANFTAGDQCLGVVTLDPQPTIGLRFGIIESVSSQQTLRIRGEITGYTAGTVQIGDLYGTGHVRINPTNASFGETAIAGEN